MDRTAVIDAAARVITRSGSGAVRWSVLAREAGGASVSRAWQWFEDMPALVDECYARTARGLCESLLHAETAPGTGLDKLAAFLVTALEMRRERGSFLSFRPLEGMSPAQERRLREHELVVRTRLRRLLVQGQRDGTLALRHADSACTMIFACLQAPMVVDLGPEQQMADAELIELLLAALAEPHAPEGLRRAAPVGSGHAFCSVCGSAVAPPERKPEIPTETDG